MQPKQISPCLFDMCNMHKKSSVIDTFFVQKGELFKIALKTPYFELIIFFFTIIYIYVDKKLILSIEW